MGHLTPPCAAPKNNGPLLQGLLTLAQIFQIERGKPGNGQSGLISATRLRPGACPYPNTNPLFLI